MSLAKLKKDLRSVSNPKKVNAYQRFFKTGKGEYGEGDIFTGVTVPNCRKVAQKYKDLPLVKVDKLLHSKIHEERLVALLILVEKFTIANKLEQAASADVYKFYLINTKYINNWDLVDLSASKIVGAYLSNKDKRILYKLAKSKSLWERRISIIACFYFIRESEFNDALKISKMLLNDKDDLIHKAVGWMLREIGKKNQKVEEEFLKLHYRQMPRTMLRYAIERFDKNLRQKYLKGKI